MAARIDSFPSVFGLRCTERQDGGGDQFDLPGPHLPSHSDLAVFCDVLTDHNVGELGIKLGALRGDTVGDAHRIGVPGCGGRSPGLRAFPINASSCDLSAPPAPGVRRPGAPGRSEWDAARSKAPRRSNVITIWAGDSNIACWRRRTPDRPSN